MTNRLSAVVGFLALTGIGCQRTPHLIEYDEESNRRARDAPLVVVGVVDGDTRVGGTVPARRDPKYPMQLHRARLRIENLLRGSIAERSIFIYYFGFAGAIDGPRPVGFGRDPSRSVVWLREEQGVYRTACDGWDECTIPVHSGAHPQYAVDSRRPLGYALVDLLLTRGDGKINNVEFARDIRMGVPDHGVQDYVISKLRHLAETETDDVKSAACFQLWLYAQNHIGDELGDRSMGALQSAKCNCGKNATGWPCQ